MHLVTGGAGFVGSHIAARLLSLGERVRILDNLSSGKHENIDALDPSAEFVLGDIRNPDTVSRAMDGVRFVFHHAADPSVPRSMTDPAGCYENNVMGTLHVLQAAREAGVCRVVFASSCAVYGDAPELPKSEATTPAPMSPYAASKLAGEDLCRLYTGVFGLETVSLRYFNVFGPRQDPCSAYAPVIPRFATALLAGERQTIFGDGEQTRDFVHVENVVDANLRAATTPRVAGRVFNVASGRSTSLNQLLSLLAELTGLEPNPAHAPARDGDVRDSAADIAAATADLGYRVSVSLEAGLTGTVASLAPQPADPCVSPR
jgi:UDP-glucose 4-epimerase